MDKVEDKKMKQWGSFDVWGEKLNRYTSFKLLLVDINKYN